MQSVATYWGVAYLASGGISGRKEIILASGSGTRLSADPITSKQLFPVVADLLPFIHTNAGGPVRHSEYTTPFGLPPFKRLSGTGKYVTGAVHSTIQRLLPSLDGVLHSLLRRRGDNSVAC